MSDIEKSTDILNGNEKENEAPINFKEMYLAMFGEVTDAIETFEVINKISRNLIALIGDKYINEPSCTIINLAEALSVLSKNESKNLKTAQIAAEEIYINIFSERITEQEK